MYPIGELLLRKAKDKNLRIVDVSKLIGYKNTNRGTRSFMEMAEKGIRNDFIMTNIHKALDISGEELKNAIQETIEQQKQEAKLEKQKMKENAIAAFRPHLFIKTERERPSQFLPIGNPNLKYIKLPEEILTLSFDTQMEIIKEAIINAVESSKESTGRFACTVLLFGKLTGFIYCRDYFENPEERIAFDLEGNPINSGGEHIPDVTVSVCLKSNKKDITNILKESQGTEDKNI